MKVIIKNWHAVAQWRWDTPTSSEQDDPDAEGDVCGICRVPYEGCCPTCKTPGDGCPLSTFTLIVCAQSLIPTYIVWGECNHVFHMHCLFKWLATASSKHQCPMDRRTWVTAERKVAPAA